MHTDLQSKIFHVIDETKNSSLKEILIALFNEFDLYYKLMNIRNFEENSHKAESILNIIDGFDSLSFTIDELISYFDELEENDEDISFEGEENSSDSVTLINIHKSKGLEYPFVYFPGLYKNFFNGFNSSFIVSKDFGILLPSKGASNENTSLFNHLYRVNENQKSFEEKLRLFYVALTRVRERAILIFEDKEYPYLLSLNNAKSFAEFLNYISAQKTYGLVYKFTNLPNDVKDNDNDFKVIEMKTIHVDSTPIEYKKASKEYDGQVDEEALEFGNELHYLLEIADYEKKDTSFVDDLRLKKYVSNVLNNKLFDGVKNNQILHEYAFFDEENNVNGVIDALIMRNDSIDIVDFKLKKIDDEKYVLQLRKYRDYISKITNKQINMYLLSAVTGEAKKVV